MPIALLLIVGVLMTIVWVALLYDAARHEPDFDYTVTYVEHDDDPA